MCRLLVAVVAASLFASLSGAPTQANETGKTTDPWAVVNMFLAHSSVAQPSPEVVDNLVKRLGAERFPDRDAASKALLKIGSAVQAVLEKAADDPDPEVAARAREILRETQKKQKTVKEDAERLVVAIDGLIEKQDRNILSALVGLLSHPSEIVRHYAEYGLRRLVGEDLGFKATTSDEKRAAALVKWREWLSFNKDTFPMPVSEPPCFVVADWEGKKAVIAQMRAPQESGGGPSETGGKPQAGGMMVVVRKLPFEQEVCSATPLANGNLLVGLHGSPGKAVEVGQDGSVVWSTEKFALGKGRVHDVRRLENGNTLLCFPDSGEVFEVAQDGKVIWKANKLGDPTSAIRLANGHTLTAEFANKRVVEISSDGTTTRSYEVKLPAEACLLPNGGILVSSFEHKKAIELDGGGATVWTADVVCAGLQMLPDGLLLVSGGHQPPRLVGRSGKAFDTLSWQSPPSHGGTVRLAPPGWLKKKAASTADETGKEGGG